MQFGTFNEKKKIIQLKPSEPCSVVFRRGKKKRSFILCRGGLVLCFPLLLFYFLGGLNLAQLASYIEPKRRKKIASHAAY